MYASEQYAGSSQIHRSQREKYTQVLLPLLKMERYPEQNHRISQSVLGRIVPGFKDPAVSALPGIWNRLTRKVYKHDARQLLNEPEVPGVPGSGRRGKEIRDQMAKDKNNKFHKMGDANTDPAALEKLHQLVSGGGQQIKQTAQQAVSIPDQIQWR